MNEILTERLKLRALRAEDAEAMYGGWTHDDDVTRYVTWPSHDCFEDTVGFLAYCVEDYKDPACRRWGIEERATGQLVGMVDVVDRIDGMPEIGYVLRKASWNLGYMTEAVLAVCEELFGEGEKGILIEADVRNFGSCRVAEKCGFAFLRRERKICSSFKPWEVEVNWYLRRAEER